MAKPRIIVFDLETLPNLRAALENWPGICNSYGKITTLTAQMSSIICAGWKVHGERKTHCINAWDFPRWKKDVNDDFEVVKALYEVLASSDAIVTHNGVRFDWKHLQTRIIYHGLPPLPKIPHIDTKQLASRHLYAFNNRLGNLGKFLEKEDKLDHDGWEMWVDVYDRKAKAMRKMEKYCKQDVNLLDKLFTRLKPFAKLPNYNLFTGESGADRACPSCGSVNAQSKGWRYTATMKYRRYICKQCGSYFMTDRKNLNPRGLA